MFQIEEVLVDNSKLRKSWEKYLLNKGYSYNKIIKVLPRKMKKGVPPN